MTDKALSKAKYTDEIVSSWYKAKGFDLVYCQVWNKMFGLCLNVVYADLDEFARWIKSKHNYTVEKGDALAMYLYIENPNGEIFKYMLIQTANWTADQYGTICHELHHFTHLALADIGIEYGRGGEELFAYFQGHYMEMVVRAFIELHKILSSKKIKK